MIRTTCRIWAAVILVSSASAAQTIGPQGCTLLAFGDVNLGREVGQHLLAGDTLYPFRGMQDILSAADLVFANLESPLTDQGGETRHPTDGYRFCGPRSGAATLAAGGITIVAGANNHAYDYGRRGLLETLSSLDEAGGKVGGLTDGSDSRFEPIVVVVNGVRIGFVAYTEFVNTPGAWKGRIALFDRGRARREIRELASRADIVIASYHGGSEYTAIPPRGTLRNLRALAELGADVVLGHHPHVPQGVEVYRGSIVCYSLGNFVFYQPQRYWTQIGLAAFLRIGKAGDSTTIDGLHLVPFRAGLQPAPILSDGDLDSLEARFNATSPSLLRREGSSFFLSRYDHSSF